VRTIFKDRNIRVAYLLCLTLGVAYGMVLAIVSLYLSRERGYDEPTIAGMAAFFSIGIAACAVPMGMLVRKLSPRIVLAISLLGYGLAVAVFPFMPGFGGLAGARAFDGAFSVGVWITLETVLLMRTTSLNRGFVTSLYSIVLAVGYVLGSVITYVMTKFLPDWIVFVAAGSLAAVGALTGLILLDKHIQPVEGSEHAVEQAVEPGNTGAHPPVAATSSTGLSMVSLYWRIKTACMPTFMYGYFQASLVLFLPLFLIEERNIGADETKLMVAFFSIGMVICVGFVGHLGDRVGHLKIMRVLVTIGALITASVVFLPSYPLIAAAVFIAGGALAPLWPLGLALQSLIVDPRDYNRSNALLNASYAIGTLAGPIISGFLKRAYGGEVMFLHLAALWLVVLGTTIAFRRDDPSLRTRRR
jgi:MFS family permease